MPLDLLSEQYGPLFYADLGPGRRLYACSLALVDELCDESRFSKALTGRLARFRPVVGNGLFTAYPGEEGWQEAHDVLIPGFSFSGLRSYHPAMLDINRQLIAQWDAAVGTRTVDVAGDLAKLAMDTVGLAGFGARFDSYQHDGLADIPASFAATLNQILLGPGADQAVFETERGKLFSFIADLIAQHRAGEVDLDDLLALMLQPGPDGTPILDDDSIRNQIATFLVAGQDTTSILMPTALYSIVKNPAVLHRAQTEADAVFGPDDDHVPAFDEIGKLTYIRQIIDEALRLSPPVREFDRMALADTVIGGRYPVRQGEAVTVLTSSLHRQPEWGDNVEIFDPDRFGADRAGQRPVNLFKPFGTGARSCIGRQFALHEATMALATLVHRYRFVDVEHYTLRTHSDLLRKPEGFHVQLIRRTPEERTQAPAAVAAAPVTQSRAAVPPGTKLLVLHGSNLGNCRSLAQQLGDEAVDLGYETTVAALDSATAALPEQGAVVIVAASYNGMPTDDARAFVEWLDGPDATAPAVPYAVLGVGDRNWAETYMAIPRRIDARLAELSATQLLPMAEADTSGDFAGVVEDFSVALWNALGGVFGTIVADEPVVDESLYDLRAIDGPVTAAIDARHQVQPATVLDNIPLVDTGSEFGQDKRLIRIALPDGVDYQTGDHLTVLPDNSPVLVDEVGELLDLRLDRRISINPRRSTRRAIPIDREVTVRELLTHFLELRKPANPKPAAETRRRQPVPTGACRADRSGRRPGGTRPEHHRLSGGVPGHQAEPRRVAGTLRADVATALFDRHFVPPPGPGSRAGGRGAGRTGPLGFRRVPRRLVQLSRGCCSGTADSDAGRPGSAGVPGRRRSDPQRHPGQRRHGRGSLPRIHRRPAGRAGSGGAVHRGAVLLRRAAPRCGLPVPRRGRGRRTSRHRADAAGVLAGR